MIIGHTQYSDYNNDGMVSRCFLVHCLWYDHRH